MTTEKTIARRFIRACVAKGYTISIHDGQEWAIKKSAKESEILDAMNSTGMDLVRVRNANGEKVADFSFIWGNDPNGEELLADFSDNEAAGELYRLTYPNYSNPDYSLSA